MARGRDRAAAPAPVEGRGDRGARRLGTSVDRPRQPRAAWCIEGGSMRSRSQPATGASCQRCGLKAARSCGRDGTRSLHGQGAPGPAFPCFSADGSSGGFAAPVRLTWSEAAYRWVRWAYWQVRWYSGRWYMPLVRCPVCGELSRSAGRCRRCAAVKKSRRNADAAAGAALVTAWRAEQGNWCPGWGRPGHQSSDLTASHRGSVADGAGGGFDGVLCRGCNARRGRR